MNQEEIPQLHKIILSSAYRRRSIFRKAIPVYRVTGKFERKISFTTLTPASIEEKLSNVSRLLEEMGYVKWIVLVYEESLHFLFGQCKSLREAELLRNKIANEITEYVEWPVLINLFDPDGDIQLSMYSTSRQKVIRARKPIGVDAYFHEIVAELFYHPQVPASPPVERLKEEMGTGRFQSAMVTLERAARKLEKNGWIITVRKRKNLPGIILTPEGHSIAKRFSRK